MEFEQLVQAPRVANRVIAAIAVKIATGELKPGDRLPSEAHLAEAMDVSIPPVREALAVLESLDLIATRHGSGRRVKGLSFAALTDKRIGPHIVTGETLLQLYEVRRPLEVAIARAAATRATDGDLRRIEESLRRMKEAARAGADCLDEDADFHAALAQATHNQLLELTYGALAKLIYESRRVGLSKPGRIKRVLHEHAVIAEAVSRADPHAAEEAMVRHIQPLSEDAIAEIRRSDPTR